MTDVRWCALGDSFVAGIGDPTGLGWVGRVAAASAAAGLPLSTYNLGIRRDTSKDVLARFEAEAARRFPLECGRRAVISVGVNDAAVENGRRRVELPATVAAVQAMISSTVHGGNVLVVGPPAVPDPAHDERVAELDRALAAAVADRGVPYLPVHAATAADEVWRAETAAGDGYHPGAAGYEHLADLVVPALVPWLATLAVPSLEPAG